MIPEFAQWEPPEPLTGETYQSDSSLGSSTMFKLSGWCDTEGATYTVTQPLWRVDPVTQQLLNSLQTTTQHPTVRINLSGLIRKKTMK